ncbi:MAG: GGDEF domain-containing response regulator [Acidobacteriota bacterium]
MLDHLLTYSAEFQELRRKYLVASTARVADLEVQLQRLQAQSCDMEAQRRLVRLFHGLAGSGGTYGFSQVSSVSSQGEQEVGATIETSQQPTSTDLNRWRLYVESIKTELDPASVLPSELSASGAPPVCETPHSITAPIDTLLVHTDAEVHQKVSLLAQREGISLRIVTTKAEAQESCRRKMPDGIITDSRLSDGSGYEVVEMIRSIPGGDSTAAVIVDGVSDFLDKVEAIRCGADGFYDKPIDWENVMRRMQHLMEKTHTEAARILYVEDDETQSSLVQAILESVGYTVCICNDPKTFETDLKSFHPDLVLMDVLLPDVTGYELVKYIRQLENYATLPIIFLTTQNELQGRIEGAKAGGDGRLIKPVAPGLLLSAVAARIERAQFLKKLLERDGLTQLLSHTAFLERAKTLVAYRKRQKAGPTAMAMVDLDHFKLINDTYGHAVGDTVLTELAALFRRRLRLSDLVGRYGGEEFAIILDNLQGKDAVRLMTRLLEEFASIEHEANDGTRFCVTFSAGIAMLDQSRWELEQWKQAADAALYEAKASGRCRVLPYGGTVASHGSPASRQSPGAVQVASDQ